MEIRQSKTPLTTTQGKVSGYAVVFNEATLITERGRTFTEVVKPGALKLGAMRLYWNHNTDLPLANTESGTLRVTVDDKGLRFDADLPESAVREKEALQRGDVTGMSFGFIVNQDRWQGNTRSLTDIEVKEISITAEPAYKSTSVKLRSVESLRFALAKKRLELAEEIQ